MRRRRQKLDHHPTPTPATSRSTRRSSDRSLMLIPHTILVLVRSAVGACAHKPHTVHHPPSTIHHQRQSFPSQRYRPPSCSRQRGISRCRSPRPSSRVGPFSELRRSGLRVGAAESRSCPVLFLAPSRRSESATHWKSCREMNPAFSGSNASNWCAPAARGVPKHTQQNFDQRKELVVFALARWKPSSPDAPIRPSLGRSRCPTGAARTSCSRIETCCLLPSLVVPRPPVLHWNTTTRRWGPLVGTLAWSPHPVHSGGKCIVHAACLHSSHGIKSKHARTLRAFSIASPRSAVEICDKVVPKNMTQIGRATMLTIFAACSVG